MLAFGNGACAHTNNSEVTRALTFIASKGFAVVDTGSADSSANLVTVPAVLAMHPQAGHVGFITGNQMTDGMTTVVQFLDMVLNGDQTARSYILDSAGLASRYPWTVSRKNF